MSKDMIGGGTHLSWLLIAMWAWNNPQHWLGVRRYFWLYMRGGMDGRRYSWVWPREGAASALRAQMEIEAATEWTVKR